MAHRRQRHLNPRDAGAVLVLDSRFIAGLSDNDPISTWYDRSRLNNNATQSGTARPVYKTSIQGGQPVVRFNGTDSSFNLGTSSALQPSTLLVIATIRRTSDWSSANFGVLWCKNNGAYNSNGWYFTVEANTANKLVLQMDGSSAFYNGSNPNSIFSLNGGTIFTIRKSTNQVQFLYNGTSISSQSDSSTITSTTQTKYLGDNSPAYAGGLFPGDMAQIIISADLSISLRRRLEQFSALSFKIACS